MVLNDGDDRESQNSSGIITSAMITPSLKRKLIGTATVHIDNFTADGGESPFKGIKKKGGAARNVSQTL